MKRAIELVRVSTLGQASNDHASIESQRTLNRRTAAQYGLTIVRSIEIAGVSGTAVLLAPEMQEMIRLMADPEIHGVIAREFSRLMRPENYADYGLLQVFVDTKTILYLPAGPIDFASSHGRLLGTVSLAIGGIERSEMLQKSWNAREEKRRRGEFAQSKVCLPFGVDYDPSKGKDGWSYTPDAERVKEAFRLVLAGDTSYWSISKRVAIPPRAVGYILKNPIYTGWRVITQKRDLSSAGKYATKDGRQGDRRKVLRSEDEVIRVQVLDPLVSIQDFNLVQKILGMKKSFHWRTTPNYEQRYTYNGYLSCTCNGRVYSKHMRVDYYVCKEKCGAHQMRRDRLDPFLDKMFAKKLNTASFLKRIAGTKRRPAANIDQLKRQIELLTAKRERVLETYYEGIISESERNAKVLEVERERQVFTDLLLREDPTRQIDTETLARQFKVFAQFDMLNRDQKRRLLNTITPEIVVANYQVEGLFCSVTDFDCSSQGTHRAKAFPEPTGRIWLRVGLLAA